MLYTLRSVGQSFLVALEMLRLHKLRAFLTMLGVIIGVMAVTTIVMIANGFQAYMGNQFNQLGADSIYVLFDPGRRMGRESRGVVEGLKMEDAAFLRERIPVLDVVSPLATGAADKVVYADRRLDNPRIFGQDAEYGRMMNESVTEGRTISDQDVATRANVVVIGNEVKDRLFPDGQALGKFVTLPGITLEVIGVLERRDVMGGTNGRDLRIPITTLQDKWTGSDNLMMIAVKPKASVSVTEAMDRIWRALMVKSGNKRIYRVDSNESITAVFNGVFQAAGTLLAAIAALSLLVGGIGIMNIMLVSVTERTKEIGLRKAVGARSGNILLQFLVESATLSLVGGLIGMGIAWGLGSIVTLATAANNWPQPGGLPTPFPIYAALGAAAFSALIGVVFGLYPAISASRLDPIVALRRE